MQLRFLLFALLLCVAVPAATAQDTLSVSLQEFIRQGTENSGQLEFEQEKVRLANNRIDQARSQRYLPRFELNTQHGVVPGVKSDRTDLSENEYYLDPNLDNDWENWGLYTRAEVSAVQPVFTWGALSSAVKAAEAGADAARHEFDSRQAGLELRLYELYHSYMMTRELQRLLDEARGRIEEITSQLEQMQEEGNQDFDQSDLFKFRVFRSEFDMRAAEVRENMDYIRRIWNYVLQADPGTVYVPEPQFLDPVNNVLRELSYYRGNALKSRPELQGIDSGIRAAEFGLKATRSQALPTLFVGLSGSYANTPNRPRQSNPFIINNTNYATGALGFGIRQNLDIFGISTRIERSRIQLEQAQDARSAAMDGIVLELNDHYKNASLSRSRLERLDEALTTTKEWLRQEQLDYDLGFGDTKDLLDALRKELELRVQIEREVFEHNKNMAELFKAAGLPITHLSMNQP
ncbi:MAG: TolC family protein [Balneolaceae bacterium]|nr:TolC family protein [Balneolaceae bacterium]